MNPALISGQEMDEGLEEMWTESIQNISRINPCKCTSQPKNYVKGVYRGVYPCFRYFPYLMYETITL